MGSSSSKPVPTVKEDELTKRLEQVKIHVDKYGLINVDDFCRQEVESWRNMKIHLAVTGDCASGKSSFINAVREIKANEQGAAPVSVAGSTKDPTAYSHPNHENIIFWDLPGIGTITFPNIQEYCEKVGGLQKYDAFLIFSKFLFTQHDKELAGKVSKELKKPFFFVRTHVDYDLENAEKDEGPEFDEASVLENIKKDCLEKLKGLICDEKHIYLIDNKFTSKYDFNRLCCDVISEFVERRSERFLESLNYVLYGNSSMTEEEQRFAQIRDFVDRHGISGIEDFYQRQISSFGEIKIHLAITGDSGAGKSSFINAARGLKASDEGAAPVGVIESTLMATEYTYSNSKNIIFWDLPGIGTPTYPNLEEYCKKVGGLQKYDAFLIFCKFHFTHHDKELAEKVSKELKKPFFFVRTHVDDDLGNAEKDEGPEFDEATVLENIKKDCLEKLEGLIHSEQDIYIIDNKVPEKYDFDRLVEAISSVLPERKRECFVLSSTNLTRDCIKRKSKWLKDRAAKVAAVAAGVNTTLPIGQLVVNRTLISSEVKHYCEQFGLSHEQFQKLSACNEDSIYVKLNNSNKNAKQIAFLYAEISKYFGIELMKKFTPVVGPLCVSASSFLYVYDFLSKCIDSMEQDALATWENTVKNNDN